MLRHPWKYSGQTIDFIQHIRATPEAIWEALTTPERIAKWLGASDWNVPLEEGQPFSISWDLVGMASGAETKGYTGTVARVVPGRQLALEWHIKDVPEPTYLSLTVRPSYFALGNEYGEDTDLHFVQSGFPHDGQGAYEFDGHSRHWRQAIGELAAMLEGRPGKPTPYALAGLLFFGGAPGRGVLVRDAVLGGPGDQAGIERGDVILSVDGHELEALDDFHDWIDYCSPGDTGRFQLQDRVAHVTLAGVDDVMGRMRIGHKGEAPVPAGARA
jgi:uncharacterized protein YndB with AHSA1/START domain